jgi:caffeoyl-CoA O-methyltransferase
MADELTYAQVQDYLNGLLPPRPAELEAMEAYAAGNQFPIIGPTAGHLCYQIARMIGARHIFEMGSGFGYSTAWFARAVVENGGGIVHHVVWDAELSQKARRHLGALGYDRSVQYHVGEAIETLQAMPGPFDLIFNDIEKDAYPKSIPVIAEKLRPGGVLIADNALWYGRVLDDEEQSGSTKGVREFTRLMADDPNWITSLIPIRDGLLVAYKAS